MCVRGRAIEVASKYSCVYDVQLVMKYITVIIIRLLRKLKILFALQKYRTCNYVHYTVFDDKNDYVTDLCILG
jgi:hypothetical protein